MVRLARKTHNDAEGDGDIACYAMTNDSFIEKPAAGPFLISRRAFKNLKTPLTKITAEAIKKQHVTKALAALDALVVLLMADLLA
jgi:hypothetical protein